MALRSKGGLVELVSIGSERRKQDSQLIASKSAQLFSETMLRTTSKRKHSHGKTLRRNTLAKIPRSTGCVCPAERCTIDCLGAAVRDAANRRRLKTEGARLNILLD